MPIHLSICESDLHFKNLLIESIERTLTFTLLDYYTNGFELINRLYYKQNNFLLIDAFTPILTGLEAIKLLRQKNNQTPIITYSQVYQEDVHHLLSPYHQVYYCQKDSAVIFKMLHAIHRQDQQFPLQHLEQWKKRLADYKSQDTPSSANVYNPSSIELKIIHYACRGLTNSEIGKYVHLSGRTVETYIKKMTEKFRVKNKIQLITHCVEQNLHNYS